MNDKTRRGMHWACWKNTARFETLDGALASPRGYGAWHLVCDEHRDERHGYLRDAQTQCGRLMPDQSVMIAEQRQTPPKPRVLTREEKRAPLWCRPVPVKVCGRCLAKWEHK